MQKGSIEDWADRRTNQWVKKNESVNCDLSVWEAVYTQILCLCFPSSEILATLYLPNPIYSVLVT